MAGFTKIENRIFEKILTSNLTKRQLKILFLIIRFSFGCQKNYAILKNNDFSYAKVSPYCIKDELRTLARTRIIKWNPEKAMVWINNDLSEWLVDNSVDNSERFIKIATKNLPKQQIRGCQNSNIGVAKIASFSNSEKRGIKLKNNEIRLPKDNIKEIINKKKEKQFLNILKEYFLKISPLRKDEIFVLRQLYQRYGLRTFEKAISIVSEEDNKSFSYFQKILDDLANKGTSFNQKGFESLKSNLNRFYPSKS